MNFKSCKPRVLNILEENDLEDYVNRFISEPTYDNEKARYKRNKSKEKRIHIDLVKDHLIPHISQLKTTKEVYDALIGLFEMNNPSRKTTLRNKLCDIKMTKDDSITTFFMKIS